jgi:hypothetical protein
MQVKVVIKGLLSQIAHLLECLSDEQYSKKLLVLSQATIGQHTRHIIEFYMALYRGYEIGIVDYDGRARSQAIESGRLLAIQKLQHTGELLARPDKELWLKFEPVQPTAESIPGLSGEETGPPNNVRTSYQRELIYNLEHTTHHMALLRIAAMVVSEMVLPEDFGVAFSTQKFRRGCAR